MTEFTVVGTEGGSDLGATVVMGNGAVTKDAEFSGSTALGAGTVSANTGKLLVLCSR